MNLKIKSVKLIDFRSFKDVELDLDDVTVLIGSNNVGKTNLLRAIELLPPEKQIDVQRDLRRGSSNLSPELIYKIEFKDIEKISLYDLDLPKVVLIKKTIDSWKIFQNDGLSTGDLLIPDTYFKNSTETDVTLDAYSIPVGKIIKGSLLSEESKQTLTPIDENEAKIELDLEILNVVKNRLPLIQNIWNPSETDFLTEDTPVDQLLKDENLPISRLLIKTFQSNPNIGDYRQILPKGIHSEIQTFCQKATVEINRIFSIHWKFKPQIKLDITYADSLLRVFFNQGETGLVEPLFSSDGLQWLISYFVRFGMTDVENQIILFDQPGEKLYPGGQKDLVTLIENIGIKNQLIYTTHSPFMISKSKLGRNVRIISKPTDIDGHQIDYSAITNEIKEVDIRKSQLLNEALGFFWTDFIPVGDFNVLMEGKLDAAIVVNTEKQKANKYGKTEIDFNRTVIKGMGKASNIGPEAARLKADSKEVFCVYDADWNNPTPEITTSEKIKLNQIDTTWIEIEDLIPISWIKEIFKQLSLEFSIPFRYTKQMNGPARGQKIKNYLKKKENKINYKRLINDFEIKMIDYINLIVDNHTDLPEDFYKLNKKIIENIRY